MAGGTIATLLIGVIFFPFLSLFFPLHSWLLSSSEVARRPELTRSAFQVSTYYTSHVLWRYCMKHPEIRDICDAAYALYVLICRKTASPRAGSR